MLLPLSLLFCDSYTLVRESKENHYSPLRMHLQFLQLGVHFLCMMGGTQSGQEPIAIACDGAYRLP